MANPVFEHEPGEEVRVYKRCGELNQRAEDAHRFEDGASGSPILEQGSQRENEERHYGEQISRTPRTAVPRSEACKKDQVKRDERRKQDRLIPVGPAELPKRDRHEEGDRKKEEQSADLR